MFILLSDTKHGGIVEETVFYYFENWKKLGLELSIKQMIKDVIIEQKKKL